MIIFLPPNLKLYNNLTLQRNAHNYTRINSAFKPLNDILPLWAE